MSEYLLNLVRGILMGTAEGIPGVSGSTIALLLGIYDRFIKLLHDVSVLIKVVVEALVGRKNWKQAKDAFGEIEFKFAIPLGLGTALALTVFALLIDSALENFPMQVYAVFVGLTLASLVIPFSAFPATAKYIAIAITSACLTFLLFELAPQLGLGSNGFTPLYLFGAGFVAISGMIFPGVSGSFILLLLGLYQYVYTGTIRSILTGEIETQRLIDFAIFVFGILVGFVILVRVIKKALEKNRELLMSVVAGVLIASLRVLWPLMQIEEGKRVSEFSKLSVSEVDLSVLLQISLIVVASACLGLLLSRYSKRMTPRSIASV